MVAVPLKLRIAVLLPNLDLGSTIGRIIFALYATFFGLLGIGVLLRFLGAY